MPLPAATIDAIAQRLDHAARDARGIRMVSDEHPEMDVADAYAVQDALRRRRLAAGLRMSGFKAGLTSLAKIRQMGVDSPAFGFLTADTGLADGAEIRAAAMIHPRVEAEIGIVTKAPLGSADCGIDEVLAAIDHVVPALEIIDSRFENFKFDLRNVIADNTSAARYVVGRTPAPATGLDLAALEVEIEKNGAVVARGNGAAVLGHPAAAVAALARHLHARGERIPAGSFILSGAVAEAISVQAGDVVVSRVAGLGVVGARFS
jgi:2-oxo-3-hexenedioate decarboxylase